MRTRGMTFRFLGALHLSLVVGLTGCSTPESRAIKTLRSPNPSLGEQLTAVRQLQAVGKSALLKARPDLLQHLQTTDPGLRHAIEDALVVVGPETAGDLIDLSKDPNQRLAAFLVLRQTKVDDALIEKITMNLRNEDEASRLHAVDLLGVLAVRNNSALVPLQGLLSDQDPLIRIAAINELSGSQQSQISSVVPALVNLLDDDTIGVREAACVGLGNIGPPAIGAKSALHRIADEHGTRLPELARIALISITRVPPVPAGANTHAISNPP